MAKSKLNKIFAIICLIGILIILYLGFVAVAFFRNKNMPLQTYSQTDYLIAYDMLVKEYDNLQADNTNEFYKKYIENSLNIDCYFYKETELECAGRVYVVIRLIVIDDDASGYNYCLTFAHEMMHLKRFIKQEDYICFETFKYLYEDKELHNVGVWYGLKQLNGHYSKEYDISGLVVNYLTNK
jgi:hypothetical protein